MGIDIYLHVYLMNNMEMKVNDKCYEIIKLLGKGKGGYSYLAKGDMGLVVLKQIHHEPCSYYNFGNKIESELNDYKRLKDTGINIPLMIDIDIKEERIVKEYIDGDTILESLLKNNSVEKYYNQVFDMQNKVRSKGLNIDYFPTNFVIKNDKLYYIDYECNEYSDTWNFDNWGIKYWSFTKELEEYLKNH